MSLWTQLPRRTNGTLVVVGLVAGGVTALVTDSVVPPAAVAAATFVLIALQELDGLPP